MKPLDFIAIPVAAREEIAEHSLEDIGRAVLLALYCGRTLNSGRIEGWEDWTNRQWLSKVGLDFMPHREAPGLWHWEGEDLIVDLYSADYEQKVITKRKSAKRAVTTRWKRKSHTNVYTDVHTDEDTDVYTDEYTSKVKKSITRSIITPYSRNNTSCNTSSKNNNIQPSNDRGSAGACACESGHETAMVQAALVPREEMEEKKNKSWPKSKEEVTAYAKAQTTLALTAEQREEAAAEFFDEMEAAGWKLSGGRAVYNWRAACRSYLAKRQRYAQPASRQQKPGDYNLSLN